MKKSMKYTGLLLMSCMLILSCNQALEKQEIETQIAKPAQEISIQTSPEDPRSYIEALVQETGSYADLWERKDVAYTYTYTLPDGKQDVIEERYLFEGELSYGKYVKHERSLTELEGPYEQGYDGEQVWLRHDGAFLEDEKLLSRASFNRKTNFYWFTMMQKLLDPGLIYDHVKAEQVNGEEYDVVRVSFDTDSPSDIYQLWLNKETHLVDFFLFTIVDYRSPEEAFIMEVEYTEVDGMKIPSKRRYTQANWEGQNLNEDWIEVNWTDIRFDTYLEQGLFERF